MASNQPAYAPARPEGDTAPEWDYFAPSAHTAPSTPSTAPAQQFASEAVGDPHRLPQQRTAARGTAGIDFADITGSQTAPVAPVSLPVPFSLTDAVAGAPTAGTPSYDPTAVGGRLRDDENPADPEAAEVPAPVETPAEAAPAVESEAAPAGAQDPGEALCARILGQVAAQREAVAQAEREAAERDAAREAAARKVREQAAAAKAAAEAKAKAESEAAARAEEERLALLAVSYIKPVASYTLTAGFGEADPWANLHTGQDFTAPTGTPVHAIHTGTVTSAGWAGSYGYRVVLTLDDGTELWYCHLSTMVVTEGQVTTGDTVGRVGATGNVPAPHLHLEVRPGGGAPVDPLPWLRGHDVAV